MKVKIFDESHESDLEKSVNDFLKTLDGEVVYFQKNKYFAFQQ